jgi:ArsR family transcriptional regulator
MYQQVFHLHANLLKALSHPKRLEIIQLLRHQTLSVSEIQQMLGLPQANLSQHLQILREHEVVETKKRGKNIYYQIAHPNFIKASDLFRQILIEKHQHDSLSPTLCLKMTDLVPLVTDPVCHMRLSPKTASQALSFNGQNYYFCASGCLKVFKKNPQKYLKND